MKRTLLALTMLASSALPIRAHAANYGPYPEETYTACGNPEAATAVEIVHGGWNIFFDNTLPTVQRLCSYLGSQGFYVIAINYRLTSSVGTSWPAAWQDTQMGVRWLRQSHKKVGVIGVSAGGYDALGITLRKHTIVWAPTDPRNEGARLSQYSSVPDFTIAISPFSDLNDAGLWRQGVDQIVAGVVAGGVTLENAYAVASPLSMVRGDVNPLLIIHGANDPVVPVDESRKLVGELKYAGANVTYLEGNHGHGFFGMTPTGIQSTFARIAKFIRYGRL